MAAQPPPASITCPVCGMTSYNPNDVLNGYCGNCHAFTGPVQRALGCTAVTDEWDDPGEISDGYHTFNELYEHRHALLAALAKSHPGLSWRSRTHADGEVWRGWFIVGLQLPTGGISYHVPEKFWADFDGVAALDRAPEWDGHSAADVVQRLRAWQPQAS